MRRASLHLGHTFLDSVITGSRLLQAEVSLAGEGLSLSPASFVLARVSRRVTKRALHSHLTLLQAVGAILLLFANLPLPVAARATTAPRAVPVPHPAAPTLDVCVACQLVAAVIGDMEGVRTMCNPPGGVLA
jgi:hypothetical protein